MQNAKNIFFVAFVQKKTHLPADVFFSVIFAYGEFYAQVRDIAFGSGMRFARWKLQGEYYITAERSKAISLLRKQKYHADKVSISRKLFTTRSFYYFKREMIIDIPLF